MVAVVGLNIGCGPFYQRGWLNTDLVKDDVITPDLVVEPDDLLPFDDDSFGRVYAGHVLEHIPWKEVPVFLLNVMRVLRSGGELMVVGPDAYRTVELYRLGAEPWDLVESVLENRDSYQPSGTQWEGARHHWNCYESRVVSVLEDAGFLQVTPVPVNAQALAGWPVVAFPQWQCAVKAVAP